jgi:hypothetical protein
MSRNVAPQLEGCEELSFLRETERRQVGTLHPLLEGFEELCFPREAE